MSAIALLSELSDAGIRLSYQDTRLLVEARPESFTAELRDKLAVNKPFLLALLPAIGTMRTHLLTLAAANGLPADLVHRLPAADLAACEGYTDTELQAYLRALEQSARMDEGLVPADYTVATVCAGCGPVWLWPGVPDTFTACPWCARHKAGLPVPRPCITCQPEEAKR